MKRIKYIGCLGLFIPLFSCANAGGYINNSGGNIAVNDSTNISDYVWGGSSSWTQYLNINGYSGNALIEYNRSDFDNWYASSYYQWGNDSVTVGDNLILTVSFSNINTDIQNNVPLVAPNATIIDEWVDISGFSSNLQEKGYDPLSINKSDIMDTLYIFGDYAYSPNGDIVGDSLTADLVGSVVIGYNGIKNNYSVDDIAAAWADFVSGVQNVTYSEKSGNTVILGPQQTCWTNGFAWKVYGAYSKHLIMSFSLMPESDVPTTPSALISSYNNNRGGTYKLYSSSELNDLFNPLFDGDISLGNGSTNNFVGVLKSLFMPTYSGIENNYNDMIDSLGILYMPIDYIFGILATVQSNYNSDMVLEWGNIDIWDSRFLSAGVFRFSPSSIFPSDLFVIAQYFAMFGVLAGLSIATWRHLFGSDGSEGGSAI